MAPRRRFVVCCAMLAMVLAMVACDDRLPPRLTVLDDSLFTPAAPIGDEFGYPPLTTDKRRFLRLLREKQWAELERELAEIHQRMRADIRNEYLLREAYFAFHNADPGLQPAMAAWLAASATAAEAHFANAVYSLGVASSVRGDDSALEIAAETHARVRALARTAIAHARRGFEFSADHLIGHVVIVRALRFDGWTGEARAASSAALQARS